MPEGKPTAAPFVVLGAMVSIAIICVGAVLYMHSQRTEPYMDSKRVRRIIKKRPASDGSLSKTMPANSSEADAGQPLRVDAAR